jgi:glycosyltransferase involved in cell wall biosynthesis
MYTVGQFRYHLFLAYGTPALLRRVAVFLFYLRCGLRLHRERKFDVIMAYGTNRTGIAAVFLKWLTGAKMIAEVPGVPEDAFRYDQANAGFRAAVKRFVADRFLSFVVRNADSTKLLYPSHLDKYPSLRKAKTAVFHDHVPLGFVAQLPTKDEHYVLSMGYPSYRKGIDVLIKAFRLIAPRFPEYKLKLVGHFPDRGYLDQLAAGCPQIEILGPRSYVDALKAMSACAVYVSASRSEAMGRVLLEAMALKKPIVASSVNGVPFYIDDNDNGLLFESENVEDLASKLAVVLGNSALRERLGAAGYERAMSSLDERAYARSFRDMLGSVLGNCDIPKKAQRAFAKA